MNDLTARLIIISEADNYAYTELKRAEESAYQTYLDIFSHSESMKSDTKYRRPHYHWHDWTKLSDIARKPFWEPKIQVETRLQLIAEFEKTTNKLLFGALLAYYEREEGMSNEQSVEMVKDALDFHGWLDDAHLCHKIDSIVRSALIKINMPQAGGFGNRINGAGGGQ